MSNFNIQLLNLVDKGIIITDHETIGNTLTVHLEKRVPDYLICPLCGCATLSKGSYIRTLNHPVFQDGRKLVLKVKRRKRKCSNPFCGIILTDQFTLFTRYKHSTNLFMLLVLEEMKNLNQSVSSIAQRFSVSDSCIKDTFMNHVSLDRLPLNEIISVDEVYINFDTNHKYPMIIYDFIKSEPVDILKSRRKEEYEKYFLSIPRKERETVKYLICDMYNPYISFVYRYFPNARAVVDCFHVIKWLNDRLNNYIWNVRKKYMERDKNNLRIKNKNTDSDFKSAKESREVYILKKCRWVLLENRKNIDYSIEGKWDYFLNQQLDTYQYEKMFLALDDKFSLYREMKEKYISFNDYEYSSEDEVKSALDSLIKYYRESNEKVFVDFAGILARYEDYIIRSFTTVDTVDNNGVVTKRRLSNGPIESFNNKPKDLKRISKGLNDFDYFRNRILWATRKNPSIK